MRFTDNCIVPLEGHRNPDGYIRVLTRPRSKGGKLKFLHRIEWEKVNGPIPKGMTINHKCKNRECCNVDHLEVLSKSEHASKDNSERYKKLEDEVIAFYMQHPITQWELGQMFGLSQSGVSLMIARRL